MSSSILYQNASSTTTIIDIPKSIEEAQGSTQTRRLLSSEPVKQPFPSLNPKSLKAKARLGTHSIEDLLIQRHLEFALTELKSDLTGGWCLPRITDSISQQKKRKREQCREEVSTVAKERVLDIKDEPLEHIFAAEDFLFQNDLPSTIAIQYGSKKATAVIPPGSTVLLGDIVTTRETFDEHAPQFDLIIMDPPWPNRSARRKRGYEISHNALGIKTLLSSLPVHHHLAESGFVGIWITNKPSFRDLTLEMFDDWGVTLAEEWVWLKVTSNGEPICDLDSLWRKSYEILLVGRKGFEGSVKRRVVVGVPDLHSRKPNLRLLFETMMGKKPSEYKALEIFARNLTEGWWGWGNEVLKYQEDEHWIGVGEQIEKAV